MGSAIIAKAREMAVELPAALDQPGVELTPTLIVDVCKDVARHFFPLLAGDVKDLG